MAERLRTDWIFLFLAGLIIASIGCRLSLQQEKKTNTLDQTYQIDPQNLLKSLTDNDNNEFVLLTATPPVYPNPAVEPVEWTVSDYYFVAEALYLHAKNGTLDDWKLKDMSFHGSCREIDLVFQSAIFGFFKSIPDQDGNSRVTIRLFVSPDENNVSIYESIYTPELNEWKYIDPSQVKIDAHVAFLIAEKNGGNDFRASVNNHCTVLALYDAEGKYEGWSVAFSAENQLFKINIDPSTGEYRILR